MAELPPHVGVEGVRQEEEELSRVDQSALSTRHDLPRKPQPEGSQR